MPQFTRFPGEEGGDLTQVMVIGGGIAGPAAALSLHKAGFEVTVYEAHPDTGADIGAFLTLADNGMRALAQIGAAETVAGVAAPGNPSPALGPSRRDHRGRGGHHRRVRGREVGHR
jgi:2-polyprenyl-6-methoxyphenol hydroxylase-like FAD-dependent oxidoreductase